MKLRTFAVAAALVLFSAPALAFHCPSDIAKIDKALAAGPDLSDEQVAEVKRLRDEGERLHETGGHSQSMDTLPVLTFKGGYGHEQK